MLDRLLDPVVLKYATIPFVAAFIGWITNWIAIKMTFYPLRFVGIRPFLGWQGIIPMKAGKMAEIFVDKTMYRLGTLPELFDRMEPGVVARHVAEVMDRRLAGYTDEVMFYGNHPVWRLMPQAMKERVYARVREAMPRLIDELMREATRDVESLIDFKDMLVTRLTGDPALLNRLFLEAGAVEFRFIVRSGLWFGFLFGLVQLAVWIVLPLWWVLPLFGLIVGYATNWFALNIIFRPLEPRRIGRWTLQGLFLKRQREVAATWCRMVSIEIVTVQALVYAMLYGPRSGRARGLVRKHIEPVVDAVLRDYEPLSSLAIGEDTVEQVRQAVGDKAVQVATDAFDDWPFNRERARNIERLLHDRMVALPPREFQDLLRPCFQEDEMKLILTGAVLGLIAGILQIVFVF